MMLPVPVSRNFTCMNERQFPFDTFAKSCTVYSLLFHSTATPRRKSIALIPMGHLERSQEPEARSQNFQQCFSLYSGFWLLASGSSYNAPMGIRTPVTGVKSQCPRPLDDGGVRLTSPA